MSKIVALGFAVLLGAGILVGRGWFTSQPVQSTTIARLDADPHDYYGKMVRVTGTVVSSTGLFGHGAYRLRDRSGSEVLVLSTSNIPSVGIVVGVQGELRQAFVVDAREFHVLIQDGDYVPAR